MPSRSGITPAQMDELASRLWPQYWDSASVADRYTARMGVMEVVDGGEFVWPRWKITVKDAPRIRAEWELVKGSSGELFEKAG